MPVESAGGAEVLLEEAFSAQDLLQRVRSLLADPAQRAVMGEKLLPLSGRDAAQYIADHILSCVQHSSPEQEGNL